MSSIDQGDTVEYIAEQLEKLIKEGRGKERLWVDIGGLDEPASLYSGEVEDDDTLGNIGVN